MLVSTLLQLGFLARLWPAHYGARHERRACSSGNRDHSLFPDRASVIRGLSLSATTGTNNIQYEGFSRNQSVQNCSLYGPESWFDASAETGYEVLVVKDQVDFAT